MLQLALHESFAHFHMGNSLTGSLFLAAPSAGGTDCLVRLSKQNMMSYFSANQSMPVGGEYYLCPRSSQASLASMHLQLCE